MEELFKGKFFISDLGVAPEVEIDGKNMRMGRYAVWAPTADGQHMIVEVSGDLKQLAEKYDIPQDSVLAFASKPE